MPKIFLILIAICFCLPAYALVEYREVHTPAHDSYTGGNWGLIPAKTCILPALSLPFPKDWTIDTGTGRECDNDPNFAAYRIDKSVSWWSYMSGRPDVWISIQIKPHPVYWDIALDALTMDDLRHLGYTDMKILQKEPSSYGTSFILYYIEQRDTPNLGLRGFRIDHDAQGNPYLIVVTLEVKTKDLFEKMRGPFIDILKGYQ